MVSIIRRSRSPFLDLVRRLESLGVERVVLVTDGAKAAALGMRVHHLSAPKGRRPRLARLDEDPPSPPPPVWKWKTNPSEVPPHLREAHDAAVRYGESLGGDDDTVLREAPEVPRGRDDGGLQLAAGRVAGETLSLLVREAGTYLVDVLAGPPRPVVETGRPASPPVAAAPVPPGESVTRRAAVVTPPPPTAAPAGFVSGGDLVAPEGDDEDEDGWEFDARPVKRKLSGPTVDAKTNRVLDDVEGA